MWPEMLCMIISEKINELLILCRFQELKYNEKDDWVYGKINGGGPEMMMKNMQGDIYVKKAGK